MHIISIKDSMQYEFKILDNDVIHIYKGTGMVKFNSSNFGVEWKIFMHSRHCTGYLAYALAV